MDRLQRERLLVVLRGRNAKGVAEAARVIADAGATILEVTFTVPDATLAIAQLREKLPEALVGAGTLRSPEDVQRAVDAGAQFVVSPGGPTTLLKSMLSCGVPALPGTLSITEVMAATEAGAPAVKLFPAGPLGPGYLSQLRGPLPDAAVVPTGGIGVDEAGSWLEAGALAVGLSTALCSPSDIEHRHWGAVTERVQALVGGAAAARDRAS